MIVVHSLRIARWLDERNRINLTRKWYAKTLPFPLNLFLPDRFHKKAEQTMESLFSNIESEQVLETEVNKYIIT